MIFSACLTDIILELCRMNTLYPAAVTCSNPVWIRWQEFRSEEKRKRKFFPLPQHCAGNFLRTNILDLSFAPSPTPLLQLPGPSIPPSPSTPPRKLQQSPDAVPTSRDLADSQSTWLQPGFHLTHSNGDEPGVCKSTNRMGSSAPQFNSA